MDARAAKLEAENAEARAAMDQTRIDMDARSATCDALERNMETTHLETEQLLAQQVPADHLKCQTKVLNIQ